MLDEDCLQCTKVVKKQHTDDGDKTFKYKEDHMRLYDGAGLEWPPAKGKFDGMLDHTDQRAYEVLVYAGTMWPYAPEKPGVFHREYVDFNQSITRLAGATGDHEPWVKRIPTLTGSGMYAMRWAEPVESATNHQDPDPFAIVVDIGKQFEVYTRQLDGLELMQLVGWPMDSYIDDFPSHELASKLAGNAFSGFAIGPCMMAVMAVLQHDSAVVVDSDVAPAAGNISSSDEQSD